MAKKIFKKDTIRLGSSLNELPVSIKVDGAGRFYCQPPDPFAPEEQGPEFEGETVEKAKMAAAKWANERFQGGLQWELSIVMSTRAVSHDVIAGAKQVDLSLYVIPAIWTSRAGNKTYYCVALSKEQAHADRTCDETTKAPVEGQNGYWRRPGDSPRQLPAGVRVMPYSPELSLRLHKLQDVAGRVRRACESFLSAPFATTGEVTSASIMAAIDKEFPDVAP